MKWLITLFVINIDAHGEGVPEAFAKIPWWSRLSGKNTKWQGATPILDFIAFLLIRVLKFAGGFLYLPSPAPFPLSPTVCICGDHI
jgi:hypothetical protein